MLAPRAHNPQTDTGTVSPPYASECERAEHSVSGSVSHRYRKDVFFLHWYVAVDGLCCVDEPLPQVELLEHCWCGILAGMAEGIAVVQGDIEELFVRGGDPYRDERRIAMQDVGAQNPQRSFGLGSVASECVASQGKCSGSKSSDTHESAKKINSEGVEVHFAESCLPVGDSLQVELGVDFPLELQTTAVSVVLLPGDRDRYHHLRSDSPSQDSLARPEQNFEILHELHFQQPTARVVLHRHYPTPSQK
jgi:hypothetical protein